MKIQLTPINDLINEVKSLSKHHIANEKELDILRDKILYQTKVISSLPKEQFKKNPELLNEKKQYSANADIIKKIAKKQYVTIYNDITAKRKKIATMIATGALVVLIGGTLIIKERNKNNKIVENKTTEIEVELTEKEIAELSSNSTATITTEATTQVTTTEATTKATTTEATTKATTTEATTQATTTTEATTQATTTEATTSVETPSDLMPNEKMTKFIQTVDEFDGKMDKFEQAVLDPEKRSEFKADVKQKFITLVDFVFYGGEINGVTFDELTDSGKEKVYKLLQKADTFIMKYDPDYKEQISEKYTIVKDFAVTKYEQALEFIKEKIGEDKYNSIKEKKDNLKEDIEETGGKVLRYINDKYQQFKNGDEDTE